MIEIIDGAKEGFHCMCNNKRTFYRLTTNNDSISENQIICD